ncbi:MAG: ribonuclease E/G, partial [Polaromonas sp.]|nr:ribonuclease E/G [Polaromonas sp.]
WTAIDGAGKGGKGAFLIYQESSLVIRAIRDYFNSDIGDILFDTDDVYEQARQFMAHVMPEHEHRVKRYRDDAPLFSRFQIEHQIESAYARTVQLPSGGAIVIDHTEALVSVDVNSARAIKGGDIEETATRTNLEAADEVARQMRLRDLGGLIVIDFIDMEESRNRRDVENRLRDALRQDRARVQFGTISKFGLMEMSRQRLRPALSEGASIPCPRCGGSGHIRDTESSALQILRIIQEESLKDSTASVLCQVPVDVASFLLNEKRSEIAKIEMKQRINVLLVPNKTLETPNYKLERLKHDDPRLDNIEASYKMAEEMEDPTTVTRRSQEKHNKQEPIIKGVLPDAPAPIVVPKPAPAPAPVAAQPVRPVVAAPAEKSFFAKIKEFFVGAEAAPAPAPVKEVKKDERGEGRRDEQRGERGERSERGDRGGRGERGGRGGRGGRSEGRSGEGRGEARPDQRGGGERGERGEGRGGERRERNADGRAEGARQERSAGEARPEGRNNEARPERTERPPRPEGQGETEGRGERGERSRRGRGERGAERGGERADRPARDSIEQDLALANQAAMAAAMNEGDAAPRQERPAQDAGRDGERQPRAEGQGRRERGERGGEARGERGERGERGAGRRNERRDERTDVSTAPAAGAQADSFDAAHPGVVAGLDEAGNPVVPASSTDVQPRAEGQEEGQDRQPRERRSRDRYGRDRRERSERSDQPAEGQAEGAAPAAVAESFEPNQAPAQEKRAPAATEFVASVAPAPVPTPVPAMPVAASAPFAVQPAAAAPAAAAPAARALPKVQTYDLPLQDLAQVAQSSGLQWVNSDASKIAEIQAAMAAEPKPIHVPRERPPAPQLDASPLVLVETKRDLRDMTLPFEQPAAPAAGERTE